MGDKTEISWADSTFNPWEGCQKVGPGCDHCYAETRNARFGGGQAPNWGPGAPRRRTSESNWRKPLQWQAKAAEFMAKHGRRQRVFCASLADWLDNSVPVEWRRDLLRLVFQTPDLDWLLLTKRIGNIKGMLEDVIRSIEAQPDWSDHRDGQPDETLRNWLADWLLLGKAPGNAWIGATITSQAEADRDIPKLLDVPARVRFLSMEPLLGPVDLRSIDVSGEEEILPLGATWLGREEYGPRLDWVIVGGESGPGARPMHPDWARSLRDQCAAVGVPFLFKQWGEWGPFVNEAHYTHGGAEKHAHAWVDAETADHGLCWIVDDDGLWSNWTGEPRKLPEGEEDDQGGNLHEAVTVMGHHGKKAAGRLLDGAQHDGFPGNAT